MAVKQYGYYMKGNKICLVEKDTSFDNDVGSKEFGPGVSRQLYKSPQSTVADALEVKYVYAPTYRIDETDDTNTTLDTYKSTGGYLILEDTGSDNFSASPESLADGSYIVLKNAGRWNGLHKVSAAGAGYINTYTKYSGTGAAIAFEETVTLYYNVDALNDEADAIDLPEYLAKGLVYYVKAKIAEDQRDIELKEYFMREFRMMVEKQESSKIWGARLVVPASNAIR